MAQESLEEVFARRLAAAVLEVAFKLSARTTTLKHSGAYVDRACRRCSLQMACMSEILAAATRFAVKPKFQANECPSSVTQKGMADYERRHLRASWPPVTLPTMLSSPSPTTHIYQDHIVEPCAAGFAMGLPHLLLLRPPDAKRTTTTPPQLSKYRKSAKKRPKRNTPDLLYTKYREFNEECWLDTAR